MAVAISEVILLPSRPQHRRSPDLQYGARVASLRHDANLTQEQIAARLDLSKDGYRMYEKGYSRVRSDDVEKWARALNMPIPEVASRLEIPLYTVSPDTSDLRQLVATTLGPDNAEMVEAAVQLLAEKPIRDREVVLRVVLDLIKTFPPLSPDRTST